MLISLRHRYVASPTKPLPVRIGDAIATNYDEITRKQFIDEIGVNKNIKPFIASLLSELFIMYCGIHGVAF